jgi:hypothetical protein
MSISVAASDASNDDQSSSDVLVVPVDPSRAGPLSAAWQERITQLRREAVRVLARRAGAGALSSLAAADFLQRHRTVEAAVRAATPLRGVVAVGIGEQPQLSPRVQPPHGAVLPKGPRLPSGELEQDDARTSRRNLTAPALGIGREPASVPRSWLSRCRVWAGRMATNVFRYVGVSR